MKPECRKGRAETASGLSACLNPPLARQGYILVAVCVFVLQAAPSISGGHREGRRRPRVVELYLDSTSVDPGGASLAEHERILSTEYTTERVGPAVPATVGETAPHSAGGHRPKGWSTGPTVLRDEPLPPLQEELWMHGGSYLYEPDDNKLPADEAAHHAQKLRLPEGWEKPRPLTAFAEFLGADPVHPRPGLKWFGDDGFQWEPRFVGYGSYELFGIALEDGDRRQDGIGHQLLLDLDLRLTGTERFHVQFRPLGRKNSGGSFFQLSDPAGYQDNSTLIPDRWWFEGELYSLLGGLLDDPFTPRDYQIVAGQFPLTLHNSLLINDDILGFAVNKNTILLHPLSNLNVQTFFGIDQVDAFPDAASDLFGLHLTADYRRALIEATLAWLEHAHDSRRDARYAALSATKFFGPVTLAGRMLLKWEDEGGRGDGQLYVLESNWTRSFSEHVRSLTGIEYGVFYANLFKATGGWNSISGGNFDRLRSTFEVDPLVSISRGRAPDKTIGGSLGVQLFRHHDDESIIPEIAYEEPSATPVWGIGLSYQKKIGRRTYLQARGVRTFSSDESFRREGVFLSTFILF